MDLLQQCQSQSVFQLPPESALYNWLLAIKDSYKPVHTYLSIVLCLLGAVCNFCNIVVLTRKTMRTPVNCILSAMACCDTVVLFSNLTYTTHYTFVAFEHCVPRHWSYGWCVFLISHAHLSLVGHSSSIWLSVMLALIRYLTLRRRGKAGQAVQIGLHHSYVAIACVIVFVTLMNAPNFLTYKITEQTLGDTCGELAVRQFRNHTAFVPGVADLALKADCLVFRLAFWITGAVFKLCPCLLLTLLVTLLVRILKEVRANRQRLFLGGVAARSTTFEGHSVTAITLPEQSSGATTAVAVFPVEGSASGCRRNCSSPSPSALFQHQHLASTRGRLSSPLGVSLGPDNSTPLMLGGSSPSPIGTTRNGSVRSVRGSRGGKSSGSHSAAAGNPNGGVGSAQRADRTTRMLLAIVCVFLVTEGPQGIMAVMSGMFSEEFRNHIYNNLGDILDLLSLCNALASFTIYCTMSAQFRNEFRRVFVPTGGRWRLKCWGEVRPTSWRRGQSQHQHSRRRREENDEEGGDSSRGQAGRRESAGRGRLPPESSPLLDLEQNGGGAERHRQHKQQQGLTR